MIYKWVVLIGLVGGCLQAMNEEDIVSIEQLRQEPIWHMSLESQSQPQFIKALQEKRINNAFFSLWMQDNIAEATQTPLFVIFKGLLTMKGNNIDRYATLVHGMIAYEKKREKGGKIQQSDAFTSFLCSLPKK